MQMALIHCASLSNLTVELCSLTIKIRKSTWHGRIYQLRLRQRSNANDVQRRDIIVFVGADAVPKHQSIVYVLPRKYTWEVRGCSASCTMQVTYYITHGVSKRKTYLLHYIVGNQISNNTAISVRNKFILHAMTSFEVKSALLIFKLGMSALQR